MQAAHTNMETHEPMSDSRIRSLPPGMVPCAPQTGARPRHARLPQAKILCLLPVLAAAFLTGAAPAVQAEPMPPVPLLDQMVQGEHLKFDIVTGRIALTSGGLGTRNTSSTGHNRTESLQMRIAQNDIQLSYQRNIPTEDFSIRVSGEQAIHMQRNPKGKAAFPPLAYIQKPGRPVLLTIGSDEALTVIEAPSLWHLLLTDPERCRRYLLPMLDVLDRAWDLQRTSQLVEQGLLRGEPSTVVAARRRWQELVVELADDSFARREAADRELRAAGASVLRFLRQLDFGALVPEQQYRIRRIIEAASGEADADSVEEVVAWLSGDSAAWLILAGRADLATRRTAAARLADLLGEPLAFDPDADEADRTRQLDALRARPRGDGADD